jgi:hypothetical protein
MSHFRGAPHGIAMAIAHAKAFIDEIKMRIEMNDVDGDHRIEGLNDRCVDRVITAEDPRGIALAARIVRTASSVLA